MARGSCRCCELAYPLLFVRRWLLKAENVIVSILCVRLKVTASAGQ